MSLRLNKTANNASKTLNKTANNVFYTPNKTANRVLKNNIPFFYAFF